MESKGLDFEKSLNVKLDHILEKITTVAKEVEEHDILLNGKDGEFGMMQKIQIMWRAHVWVLCAISAVIGSGITMLVKLWK